MPFSFSSLWMPSTRTDAWGTPLPSDTYTAEEMFEHLVGQPDSMECLNRNKRMPTKSNHGARPCSSVGRKDRSQARRAPMCEYLSACVAPRAPPAVGQRLLDARCMLLLLPPRGTHASGDGLRGPVKNAMGPSLFYRNYAFGPPRGL